MRLRNKIMGLCLKAAPFCAMMMLIINSNSTGSWQSYQAEAPKQLRNYRKF